MVELVRHTLLDGSVGLNVNNVTNLVGLQVGAKRDGAMLSEVTREHMASTSTDYNDNYVGGLTHSFKADFHMKYLRPKE